MKKACCLILAALVVLAMMPAPAVRAAAPFAGGSGTSADPYQISTPEQLNAVRNYPSSCFILKTDIDLSQLRSTNWLPIGNDTKPFTGSLNGNGKTIRNLTVDRSDTTYVGLFGVTRNASIRNVNIPAATIVGDHYGGVLIAYSVNTTVYSCQVSGNASTGGQVDHWNTIYWGGLIGYAEKGTVSNASAAVNVDVERYVSLAGGLIGQASNLTVNQCSATGNIAAYMHSGGLIGGAEYSNISGSTFSGTVTGYSAGGFVSTAYNCVISSCKSDAQVTATNRPGEPYIYGGGGFAGSIVRGQIRDCEASGSVSSTNRPDNGLGGFAGSAGAELSTNTELIIDSKTSCSVAGQGTVGGFIGLCGGDYPTDYRGSAVIRDCIATGAITASGGNGFIGKDTSGVFTFLRCYALGDVPNAPDSFGFCSTDMPGRYFDCGWNNPTSTAGANKDIPGIRRIGWARNNYIPLNQTQSLVSDFQVLPTTLKAVSSDHPDVIAANSDGTVTALTEGSATVQIAVKCGDAQYTVSQTLRAGGDFSGGGGTPGSPYLIGSVAGLARMKDMPQASYKLTADVSMAGVRGWTPIGSVSAPFTGSFDGGGHTITGLTVDKSVDNAGLFGMGIGATLKNVRLEDAYVTVGQNSGALIGCLYNGSIANCSATGQITTTTSSQVYSGMIVGYMQGGTLKDCYAIGDVTSYYAGVFASYMGGTMTNCYWYNSEPEKGIAQGGTKNLNKVDMNIDSLLAGQEVQGGSTAATTLAYAPVGISATTNFNLYGKPSKIEFLKSSNTAVVSIVSGRLKALKAGTSSITTKFTYSNGKSVAIKYEAVVSAAYRVAFNSQGGSAVASILTTPYSLIKQPAAPTRAGYKFGGWYRQAACTTAWSFTATKVTAGMTLFAKWTVAPKYTVKVQTNSTSYGTVSGGGSYYNDNIAKASVLATPKAGYRFVRWIEGTTTVSTSNKYSFLVTKARTLKAEFVKIGTPTVKAASAGYNGVKLTWAAVTGATKYEVYRAASSAGTYTKLAETTSTSYVSTGLTTGKPYFYKVRVKCVAGTTTTYGGYSAVVSAKPVPAAPAGVKAARVSASSIKVSWSAVTGAAGYEVYRATASGGTYTMVKSVTTLNWTNTGLTTGKTYYYKVRAYRTVGGKKVYGGYGAVVSMKP